MMKRIHTFGVMLLMAVCSVALSGCDWDDDDEIAYTLEGTWRGNMYVSSEWDGRTYDATYSELCFLRDPYRYSSGTGYWIDHYQNAGWGRNYVANHIEWSVELRTISIYFVEEGTTIWIEDYRLSDNYFTGTIYDGDSRVKFSLRHTASPNWNDYYYGWNYGGYGDYYAKRTGGDEPNVAARSHAAGTAEEHAYTAWAEMPRRMLRSR